MLKIQEIRELIKLIDGSSIDEFEYEFDGSKIVMKKNAGATAVVAQPAAAPAPSPAPAPASVSAQPLPASDAGGEKSEAAPAEDEKLHKIVSPMVGTFYRAPSPDAEPFVKVGSKVDKDTVVCIVEAMKLFNEIEADVKGEIVEVLAENGQLVEYGQPLFLVKTE